MSRSNPFIKSSSSVPSINILDRVIKNNTTSSSFQSASSILNPKSIIKSNNGDSENINQNNIPATLENLNTYQNTLKLLGETKPKVIETVDIVQTKTLIEPLSVSPQNKLMEVTVLMNNEPCPMIQVNPLKNVSQFKKQNISIKIPLNGQKAVINRFQIANRLTKKYKSLFQLIRFQNESIFNKISNKKWQIASLDRFQYQRILQGLCFYEPEDNEALRLLNISIQGHIFYKLIRLVSKEFTLDSLKAFYVVKILHQRKLKKAISSFFVQISKNDLILESDIIKKAELFLSRDKEMLIACQNQYMTETKRPSENKIISYHNQIMTLWANIHMMQRDSLIIQKLILDQFIAYWHKCPEDLREKDQNLISMKYKIMKMKLDETCRSKIMELQIDNLIENGSVDDKNITGPIGDLYTVLIKKSQINYTDSLKNLTSLSVLSSKWLKHLQNYLINIQFGPMMTAEQKLMKGIYLFTIIKILKKNNQHLSVHNQQKILKIFCRQCSFLLALLFLKVSNLSHMNIWFIKLFLKKGEIDLKQIQRKDGKLIQNWIDDYKVGNLVQIQLSLIQNIINDYLNKNDLQTLERELSSGKMISFDCDIEEPIIHTVKFYIQMLSRLPSQQLKLQQLIMTFLINLKAKNYKIFKNVSLYNKSLIALDLPSQMISCHLNFLISLDMTAKSLSSYVDQWLKKLIQLNIIEFKSYINLVSIIGDKFLQTNDQIYLNILLRLIQFFQPAIQNYSCNESNATVIYQFSSLRLFYVLQSVSKHINLIINSNQNQLLTFTLLSLKNNLLMLYDNPITLIENCKDTSISVRVAIACQLIVHKYNRTEIKNNVMSDYIGQHSRNMDIVSFFNQICKQVSKENSTLIIDCFSYASKFQQSLFFILYKTCFDKLIQIVEKQNKMTSLTIFRLLQLAKSIYTLTFKNQQKSFKKMSFTMLTINKLLTIQKNNEQIPLSIFLELISLSAKAMNCQQYQLHLLCLQIGIKQNNIVDLQIQTNSKLGQYMLYLICLMAAKNKNKLNIYDSIHKDRLMKDIRIFVSVAITFLQNYKNRQSSQMINMYSFSFVKKLIRILVSCKDETLINEEVIEYLKQINKCIDHCKNAETYSLFKKENEFISKAIESSGFCVSVNGRNKIIKIQICCSQQQFNQRLRSYIQLLYKKQNNQHLQEMVFKINKYIHKNNQFQVKSIKINKYLFQEVLQRDSLTLPFLQFVELILTKLDNESYYRSANTQMIKQLIYYSQMKLTNVNNSLQNLLIIKKVLRIINQVLSCSMLPSVFIFSIFQSQITYLAANLKNRLQTWAKPHTSPIYHTINQVFIQVYQSPRGLNNRQYFTLWNLIQFNQKIHIICQIMKCCQLLNGLLSIKAYHLNSTIIQFTMFIQDNKQKLNHPANEEKITHLNNFVKIQNNSAADIINYVEKQIEVRDIRQKCREIGVIMNYLSMELMPKEIMHFDKFQTSVTLL